jgi:diketogulonate reductase-like aldo/keto reductase
VADWCRQRGTPLMAYSPLDQGGAMLRSPVLADIAARHQVSPAQIALAWLLHQPETVVIPKSARLERIEKNLAAVDIELGAADLQLLDEAFPAPQAPVRLGMR